MKNFQNSYKKPSETQTADNTINNFDQVNYLTITPNQDGQRIDNFLLTRLKGLPKSHLYNMIRRDEIRINGKRCKAFNRLNVGDVVRIAPVRLATRDNVMISDDFAKSLLSRILYEDDGLIVLNKPYGIAVHGGSGESFGIIEAMRFATGKKYLELIHRIDKETSGLLLIAKKRSTLKELQESFRQKTIRKNYLCLVDGHVQKDRQLIQKPLLKYTLDNGERRVKVDKNGKDSSTHIQTLAKFYIQNQAVSLVLASPLTGRTHQIRVHMKTIGHALLGDEKYQNNPKATPVKRLCLHAYELFLADCTHPKRPKSFIAQIPDDLAAYINPAWLKQTD